MAVIFTGVASSSAVRGSGARGAALAGTFCSVFGWFDFFLAVSVSGALLPRQAPSDIYSQLFMLAPLFARLLGAVIIGGYGDRVGRKAALLTTLGLASVVSLLLGLMIEFGIRDPTMALILRIMQGVAIGGTWAGCVCLPLEWAKEGEKGRFAAWPQIGIPAGLVLSQVTVFFLGSSSLGLPSLTAGTLGLLAAFVVWTEAAESPAFIDETRHSIASSPLLAAIRNDYLEILLVALVRVVEIASFFVFTGFILAYAPVSQVERPVVRIVISAACLIAVVFIPVFGRLSDRYGQLAVYAAGALVTGVWTFAYVALLNAAVPDLMIAAIAVSLVPYAMMVGPQAALIAESFLTPRRYSGSSLGTQLGAVVAAVLVPTAAGFLLARFNSAYAVACLVLGCSCVSLFAAFALRSRKMLPKLKLTVEVVTAAARGLNVVAKASTGPNIIFTGFNKSLLNILERSRKTRRRKRSLNVWIDDRTPIANKPFHIRINIGAATGGEVGMVVFPEPDWRGVDAIDLIVAVSSSKCVVDPAWKELKLMRTGDSEMLDFAVVALVADSHKFTVRVYLAKQMVRLQSLSFTVEVVADLQTVAGAP